MSYLRNAMVIGTVAALAFLLGLSFSGRVANPHASSSEPVRRILYYACPMHPQYRSDRPGDCPSCGMRLEAVYAEDNGAEAKDSAHSPPAGTIQVLPDRQQVIGVRTAVVKSSRSQYVLRTTGRVAADERRLYRVNAALDGWITRVYTDSTGSLVRRDQRLATLYSTMYRNALQSFLIALEHLDNATEGLKERPSQIAAVERTVELGRDGLRNLGMGEAQIEEITRTRDQTQNLHLSAPASGIVLSRNVYEGQRVLNGEKLYEIADLSRIWILADLFPQEARYIQAGQAATISYLGRSVTARLSDVPPQFDENSRTLKVRLEMDNPGYVLRPGMFVEAELPVNLPLSVTVPADAVVDSGTKRTVFVAAGSGHIEPREVKIGWRFGDHVQIVKGLNAGEQIVVAGNFLLDSESRMRMTGGLGDGATGRLGDEGVVVDPVCGMEVEPAKAAGKSEYQGKTYYFCSTYCKKTFDAKPEAVLAKNEEGKKP